MAYDLLYEPGLSVSFVKEHLGITEKFVLDHIYFAIPARKSVTLISPSGAGEIT